VCKCVHIYIYMYICEVILAPDVVDSKVAMRAVPQKVFGKSMAINCLVKAGEYKRPILTHLLFSLYIGYLLSPATYANVALLRVMCSRRCCVC
jgi:hypothetical protein